MNMPRGYREAFKRLANSLSPENLHEDGEIKGAEVDRKYRRLMKEWNALEALLGRKVTEEEVWSWSK